MNDHEPEGTTTPTSDATTRPMAVGASRARARGQARVAPHEAFVMRLQHLEGIGAHDEAFSLALEALHAEDQLVAKAEARRAELLAFIHDATLAHAREQHPGE